MRKTLKSILLVFAIVISFSGIAVAQEETKSELDFEPKTRTPKKVLITRTNTILYKKGYQDRQTIVNTFTYENSDSTTHTQKRSGIIEKVVNKKIYLMIDKVKVDSQKLNLPPVPPESDFKFVDSTTTVLYNSGNYNYTAIETHEIIGSIFWRNTYKTHYSSKVKFLAYFNPMLLWGNRKVTSPLQQQSQGKNYDVERNNSERALGASLAYELGLGIRWARRNIITAGYLQMNQGFYATQPVNWVTGIRNDQLLSKEYTLNGHGISLLYQYGNQASRHGVNVSVSMGLYNLWYQDRSNELKGLARTAQGVRAGAGIKYNHWRFPEVQLRLEPTMFYNISLLHDGLANTRLINYGFVFGLSYTPRTIQKIIVTEM